MLVHRAKKFFARSNCRRSDTEKPVLSGYSKIEKNKGLNDKW